MQFTPPAHVDSLIELASNLKMKFLSGMEQLKSEEKKEGKRLWMTSSTKYFISNGKKAVNELELQQFPLLDILSSSVKTLKKENSKYNSK
jgi:hypothetical protein